MTATQKRTSLLVSGGVLVLAFQVGVGWTSYKSATIAAKVDAKLDTAIYARDQVTRERDRDELTAKVDSLRAAVDRIECVLVPETIRCRERRR